MNGVQALLQGLDIANSEHMRLVRLWLIDRDMARAEIMRVRAAHGRQQRAEELTRQETARRVHRMLDNAALHVDESTFDADTRARLRGSAAR